MGSTQMSEKQVLDAIQAEAIKTVTVSMYCEQMSVAPVGSKR